VVLAQNEVPVESVAAAFTAAREVGAMLTILNAAPADQQRWRSLASLICWSSMSMSWRATPLWPASQAQMRPHWPAPC
jgi:hypothetical protein